MSDSALRRTDPFVCIFACGKPLDATAIEVEMNHGDDGKFHGNQDHLNHAERVAGIAHRSCYADWYEQTYRTPFTMSA